MGSSMLIYCAEQQEIKGHIRFNQLKLNDIETFSFRLLLPDPISAPGRSYYEFNYRVGQVSTHEANYPKHLNVYEIAFTF